MTLSNKKITMDTLSKQLKNGVPMYENAYPHNLFQGNEFVVEKESS